MKILSIASWDLDYLEISLHYTKKKQKNINVFLPFFVEAIDDPTFKTSVHEQKEDGAWYYLSQINQKIWLISTDKQLLFKKIDQLFLPIASHVTKTSSPIPDELIKMSESTCAEQNQLVKNSKKNIGPKKKGRFARLLAFKNEYPVLTGLIVGITVTALLLTILALSAVTFGAGATAATLALAGASKVGAAVGGSMAISGTASLLTLASSPSMIPIYAGLACVGGTVGIVAASYDNYSQHIEQQVEKEERLAKTIPEATTSSTTHSSNQSRPSSPIPIPKKEAANAPQGKMEAHSSLTNHPYAGGHLFRKLWTPESTSVSPDSVWFTPPQSPNH